DRVGRLRGHRRRRAPRDRRRRTDRARRRARPSGRAGGARRRARAPAVMSSVTIDNIGVLVTNEPGLGEGPLGLVRDAALLVEGDGVRGGARAGVGADRGSGAAGRCVIPGFVDSHTHLVFAGDRSEEFAARMAGKPYEASGIRVTTEATREASDDELSVLAAG